MIVFALIAILRVAVILFFLLTAAFGVVSASPFAFDMFIRPRLLPSLNAFIAWHHLWYLAAYLASVATLTSELDWRRPRHGRARAAQGVATFYVVIVGAVAVRLLSSPYLPELSNDRRSLIVGLVSFLPLLLLAIVDHLAARTAWWSGDGGAPSTTDQRRLFAASMQAAVYLWGLHLLRALLQQHGPTGGAVPWLVTGIWALALTGAVFLIVFALIALASALAEGTARPRLCEHALITVAAAVAIGEFLRRIVLPTILLDSVASALVGSVAGLTLAAAWSGLVLRRPPPSSPPAGAVDVLLPSTPNRWLAIVGLITVPAVAFVALGLVERLDWNAVTQRAIVMVEWSLVFGLLFGVAGARNHRGWSGRAPLAALALLVCTLFGVPRVSLALAAVTRNTALEPARLLPNHATAEVAFNLLNRGLTASAGQDAEYYRYLQLSVAAISTAPIVEFSPQLSTSPSRRPDIYLFVVDSLRRDYLSPYNDTVTFTPEIDRWARESFVFRNAFTRHGGTQLAMPSIWSGVFGVRLTGSEFHRMNALEKLLNTDDYQVLINDHTVSEWLRPVHPITVIDPDVPSRDTDLCSNLQGMTALLDAPDRDRHPRFGYLAPMNVHLMNTRIGGKPAPSDRVYPGFYSPYASRLQRLDSCFGAFISHLKVTGRYDDSIVILTSDHGDSLGEDGFWGHAFWLFPEDVRVPLVIHLPDRLARGLTTDLARLAFLTDIAPSLYGLLGHEVRDPGPLFGSPLFVPVASAPVDRRRNSFLLTSSYAATYGLLRRNGRLLYVSDLYERKEFAFDLDGESKREPMPIDEGMQRVNQRLIREQLESVARFYHVKPR